jgi:hypothetical protein
MALSALAALGRRTITGILTTAGQQFFDWSAHYRLFERARFDIDKMFDVTRKEVCERLDKDAPFVAIMDDTLLNKHGRKIHGAAWRRDPAGPAFRHNLTWAQRYLQLSVALPAGPGASSARAIPIDLLHCPTPIRPRKNASEEQWAEYREAQKETRISQRGVERVKHLRQSLDRQPDGARRELICAVDGSYTNSTVIKPLPERTTLIGRVRKDAKLYAPSQDQANSSRGRKRQYGRRLATPEQLRQDESVRWQTVEAFAAGKLHSFDVKTIAPVKWRAAGPDKTLRLVVIRPLGYRLTKHSKILYRKPAYLISTDPNLPLEKLIQYFLWRWEIEVNFRDEKTVMGLGQAQVRNHHAVEHVPALIVAAYAVLLLSAKRAFPRAEQAFEILPDPKWRKNQSQQRLSTNKIISLLRAQLWGKGMGLDNFSHFVTNTHTEPKPHKYMPALESAVFYACQ